MATIREQIIAAIYEQESASGRADTSKPNNAGARGPMQVIRPTFEALKSKGIIPKDWDHANPEHSKEAGVRLVHILADKYSDDPRKVAAAYYSGEKAVRADGSIANFQDRKNPTFPTTHQYVDQIVAKLGNIATGGEVGKPTTKVANPADPMALTRIGPQAAVEYATPEVQELGVGTIPVPTGLPDPYNQNWAGQEAAAREREARRRGSSFGEKTGLAWLHESFSGTLAKRLLRPDFETDPNYVLDAKGLEGMTSDEQAQMRDATSKAHEEAIRFSIIQRRHDEETIDLDGPFVGFVARMGGSLPDGALAGLGTAKAFQMAKVGASQLALAGNRTGAVASVLAENVGGNLAMTAAQDVYDPYIGAADYGMGAGMGLLVSPLSLPGLGRALKEGTQIRDFQAKAQRIIDSASAEAHAVNTKATANLGADASPEALRAEAQRVDATRIQDQVNTHSSQLPEERKILDPETRAYLSGEEPAAPAAPQKMEFPTLDERASPTAGKIEHDAPGRWSEGNVPVSELADWWARRDMRTNWDFGNGEISTSKADLFRRLTDRNIDDPAHQKIGVHYGDVSTRQNLIPTEAKKLIEWAHKNFLADRRLFVSDLSLEKAVSERTRGQAASLFHNGDIIQVRFGKQDWEHTLIHEIGHLVFNKGNRILDPKLKDAMGEWHAEWLRDYQGTAESPRDMALKHGMVGSDKVRMTFGVKTPEGFVASLQDIMSSVISKHSERSLGPLIDDNRDFAKYVANYDEFGAEQFTKYIQSAVADILDWKPASIPPAIVTYFKKMFNDFMALFNYAKDKGLLASDVRAIDFFEGVRARNSAEVTKARRSAQGLDPYHDTSLKGTTAATAMPTPVITDAQLAQAYGFDRMPQGTAQEKAEYKAVTAMYRKAMDPTAPWNSSDITGRLSHLLETSVFQGAQSTSATMLRSGNPVTRMLAVELLESPSGAGGRRSTAAIAKFMNERKYMGNVINDTNEAYRLWRNTQGGNIVGDVFNGKLWQQFNRRVAEEIEARRVGGGTVEPGTPIAQAADTLQNSYERMRVAQIDEKTIGWGALPETSVGYMPHRMSPAGVRNATNAQKRVLRNVLVEQFQTIEGFDLDFSRLLSARYMDAVERRALGGYESAAGIHQVGAADVVEDALKAMNLTQDEVRAAMQRYMRGAAGHTKQRLQLDLNRVYDLEDGSQFRLLDMFETDQLKLVRAQARRVSGETALARHGIMGKPGLAIVKRAMEFGTDAGKTTLREKEAFDQVAAEFMGDTFGTHGGKWLDRAMQANSLARLGGMGFTQFAESINMASSLGVGRALSSVLSLNRLRAEAAALARGEKVDNPFLQSLEQFGGAEFGTDNRKLVFPFDNPELQYQTFGQDTSTAADRLLRGGVHLQGKLSLWQAIHGAQQRGAAEQIVKKAMQYVKEGADDIHLDDMGIDASLRARIRSELDRIATFDGSRLTSLDITKAEDVEAMSQFVQAVHRGSSQIIQGTFVGETGKWAHDGLMKVVTQFRTFSLTSIEKQWARQVGVHGGGLGGTASALGILLGAMSFAAPIYMARVYVQSIGRKDQEAYLEKNLSWNMIARATMNYVALTGLTGDFVDALAAVAGKQTTGARTGVAKDFVGNVIAPSAGLADDIWRGVQNTKEGTDPHELLKSLPFSRLPFLIPAINALD